MMTHRQATTSFPLLQQVSRPHYTGQQGWLPYCCGHTIMRSLLGVRQDSATSCPVLLVALLPINSWVPSHPPKQIAQTQTGGSIISLGPQLTQGVVVQVQHSELGAVSHSNGQAAPAFARDTWVGTQCQLLEAWRGERSQIRV